METNTPTTRQTEHLAAHNRDNRSEAQSFPAKPWASGRTLTPAQRARKRELDRRSHKERRTSTLSRIKDLEACMGTLLDERAEIASARTTHESGGNSTLTPNPTSRNSEGFGNAESTNYSPSEVSLSTTPLSHASLALSASPDLMEGAIDLDPTTGIELTTPKRPWNTGYDCPILSVSESRMTQPTIISAIPAQSTAACSGTRTTGLCNMELSKAVHLTGDQVCQEELVNQNHIIRAVLQGWDDAGNGGFLCPLWKLLRRIDELIFATAGHITRLVMLYTVHRMLLCAAKAKSFIELPTWYRPRPTQCRFRHEPVVGYFAWPGLRERLVLNETSILSDSFWYNFAHCFRFNWPYNLADAYNVDLRGQVRFSGAFMNYLHDIRHWRMDHEFFVAFPDLSNDIIPAQEIPMSLNFTMGSTVLMGSPLTESAFPPAVELDDANPSEDVASTSLLSLHSLMASGDAQKSSQPDLLVEPSPYWPPFVIDSLNLPTDDTQLFQGVQGW